MFHKYPKLFTDPQINYPIDDLDLSFADYITQSKKIIANTRIDLTENNAETIINANAPFEFKPDLQSNKPRYGALLIHGLFDSPFSLRDIGTHLKNQGLLVRSILLPGHGTVPGALLHVDYHQWLKAVRYGIHTLSKEVDEIFLVGDSTGASLALYQEKKLDVNIAGIILLSPAFKIRSPFAPLTRWFSKWASSNSRAAWFYIGRHESRNYNKYSSFTFNAAYQVYQLTQEIKNIPDPTEPRCPLFFSLSQDDKTICPETIVQYFHQHKNPHSRLLLYTNQANQFNDSRIMTRPSAYPEMRIINFSHISIPIAPDNAFYGNNGTYLYASHVHEKNNIIYGEFTKIDLQLNAFLYGLHLAKSHYQRLTFNPDFGFMTDSIGQFIHSICDKKGVYVGKGSHEDNQPLKKT